EEVRPVAGEAQAQALLAGAGVEGRVEWLRLPGLQVETRHHRRRPVSPAQGDLARVLLAGGVGEEEEVLPSVVALGEQEVTPGSRPGLRGDPEAGGEERV